MKELRVRAKLTIALNSGKSEGHVYEGTALFAMCFELGKMCYRRLCRVECGPWFFFLFGNVGYVCYVVQNNKVKYNFLLTAFSGWRRILSWYFTQHILSSIFCMVNYMMMARLERGWNTSVSFSNLWKTECRGEATS